MKTSEIRRLSDEDVAKALEEAKRELLTLRCKVALSEDVKSNNIKGLRRDIARIMTVLRERELVAATAPVAGSEE